jgi:hypothetical protein
MRCIRAKNTGLVGPVKTEMGWHVMLVEKFEDATPKNFAEVKDVILRELKDRQIDEKMNGVTEQLENDLASASSLDAIASDHKVPLQKLADLTPDNAVKHMQDAGVNENAIPRLAEAAFTMDEGEISPIIDTKNGDMVMAANHQASCPRQRRSWNRSKIACVPTRWRKPDAMRLTIWPIRRSAASMPRKRTHGRAVVSSLGLQR